VRVFHITSPEAAAAILRDGFRDGVIGRGWWPDERGVWVANPHTDPSSLGARRELNLLAVDVPEDELADYEVIEYDIDTGERFDKGGREWIVPAAVLNRWPVQDLGDVWGG
jgi:hypothetical protein